MLTRSRFLIAIAMLAGGLPVAAQKTAHVKGYTRQDGTYVAPYERKVAKKDAGTPSKAEADTLTKLRRGSVARDERSRIQRSQAARHAFGRQTGFPGGRPGYVIDHIIPLACGGLDAPINMQWQAADAAKEKVRIERAGCQ